jgi:hypothetical protein
LCVVSRWSSSRRLELVSLIRGFVVAGGAAGLAVHETVLTNADFEYGLAQATVLVALALGFRHFALCAVVFGWAGSGGHTRNITLAGGGGHVPLVTERELLIADF